MNATINDYQRLTVGETLKAGDLAVNTNFRPEIQWREAWPTHRENCTVDEASVAGGVHYYRPLVQNAA